MEQGSDTSSSKKPELLLTRSVTSKKRPNRLTSVRYTTDGWIGLGLGDICGPWVANSLIADNAAWNCEGLRKSVQSGSDRSSWAEPTSHQLR